MNHRRRSTLSFGFVGLQSVRAVKKARGHRHGYQASGGDGMNHGYEIGVILSVMYFRVRMGRLRTLQSSFPTKRLSRVNSRPMSIITTNFLMTYTGSIVNPIGRIV
jgi:hypothetical protein